MENIHSPSLPTLSVIVPVYNVENYLRRCVDSILRQTFSDFELILIDDGSSDSSGAICDSYLDEDCRVKVIHQENKGSILARQAGLDIACGKYVAFVDSDDWIDVDLYERLLQPMFRSSDVDISISPIVREENCETIVLFTPYVPACWDANEARRYMFEGKWFDWSLCGRIYKKGLFDRIQISFSTHSHGDDAEINWEIMKFVKRVYYQPIQGYHYFDNPTSLTHQRRTLEYMFYLDRLQYISNDSEVDDYKLRRRIAKIACTTGIDYMLDLLQFDGEYDAEVISKYQKLIQSTYSMCKQLLSPPQLRRYKIALLDTHTLRNMVTENEGRIVDAYRKVCAKNSNVYIYGAGAIGKEIETIFKNNHLRYAGFVVSELDNQYFHDGNIWSFHEIYKKHRATCGFILAMNKENEAVVEKKMKNQNAFYVCVGQYSFLY